MVIARYLAKGPGAWCRLSENVAFRCQSIAQRPCWAIAMLLDKNIRQFFTFSVQDCSTLLGI